MRKLSLFAIFLCIIGGVFYWIQHNHQSAKSYDSLVGQVADMSIFESPQTLRETVAGPKLVYFTASWCPTCQENKGVVAQLPLPMYLVLYKDSSPVSAELDAKASLIVRDIDMKKSQQWGVPGVPILFLLDENNVIRWVKGGHLHEKEIIETLLPLLETLTGKPSAAKAP